MINTHKYKLNKRISMHQMKYFNFISIIVTLFFISNVDTTKLCREDYIDQNIQKADIILVGTVQKLEHNYTSNLYGALIEIHRIIKGRLQIYEMFNLKLEYMENKQTRLRLKSGNSSGQKAKRLTVNGNTLIVYNFGSSEICASDVKPNDAGVFLLKIDEQKKLKLSSSIIQPISKELRNLNSLYENQYTDRCK